ncbi:MAG: hypothetical protein NDF57_01725 [archaeon GBS-70-058]|nr:hypothetical protein [Candidatus Culexarchaeum nevadense]
METLGLLYKFLYIFVLNLIVKELSLQFFLGKLARNFKFIIGVLIISFASSGFLFIVMNIVSTYFRYVLLYLYFSSLLGYLGLFIALYMGSNLVVEVPLYGYTLLRGKLDIGGITSLLLMINMFAYFIAYLLGFVDPLAWT